MRAWGHALTDTGSHHVTMVKPIDRESPIPPYRQVAAQLAADIRAGKYEPGRRLPAVPDLMHEFTIAKTTAAKALRVLADEGLATLSPGMGYYVSGEPTE